MSVQFTPLMIKLFKYIMRQADYEKSSAVITVINKEARIDLNIFINNIDEVLSNAAKFITHDFDAAIVDAYNKLIFNYENGCIYKDDHFWIRNYGNTKDIYALVPNRVIKHLKIVFNNRLSVLYNQQPLYKSNKCNANELSFIKWIIQYRESTTVCTLKSKDTIVYQFQVYNIKRSIDYYYRKCCPDISKNKLKKIICKWEYMGICKRCNDGSAIFTLSTGIPYHTNFTPFMAQLMKYGYA